MRPYYKEKVFVTIFKSSYRIIIYWSVYKLFLQHRINNVSNESTKHFGITLLHYAYYKPDNDIMSKQYMEKVIGRSKTLSQMVLYSKCAELVCKFSASYKK